MLMVRLWGSLRVKTKQDDEKTRTGPRHHRSYRIRCSFPRNLLTDFSIRVIAAGGPHQQVPARETTMTPSTATAVMVWRSIGAAMDHAHGGVDGEQRADHARE